MQSETYTKDRIRVALEDGLLRYFGVRPDEATEEQLYRAVVMSVKDTLSVKRGEFREHVRSSGGKRIFYLCMEFLVGKSLKNSLMNLGLEKQYREVLSEMGYNLDDAYETEVDPGLGNGGLGRLAACFMDSLTTLGYSATGY